MPTITLGRVLPVDKGTWVSGAKYVKQDITDYNNKTYYCMKGHVSSDAILPTNRTYWIPMTGEAHDTVKVLSNSAATFLSPDFNFLLTLSIASKTPIQDAFCFEVSGDSLIFSFK